MKNSKVLLLLLFLAAPVWSSNSDDYEIVEPEMTVLSYNGQTGGRMITSIAENGQFLRVLIVFVQFKDDNYNPNWSEWPVGQAPTNWMNANMIDQTLSQNSTNGNLTHYYTEMSMEHFKVIGGFHHAITQYTRQEYINMDKDRGDINKEILQAMDNSGFDFAPYDNWTKSAEYDHSWGPDGEVDMIWMVYRNISKDMADPGWWAYQLSFAGRYLDAVQNEWKYRIWSGEASLGFAGILSVDGGSRTIDLNGYGLVSGVNIMAATNGLWYVNRTIKHEFGHHLLGGFEMHTNYGCWGMMGAYGSRSSMVNAFERHRLGWINLIQYDYNPLLPFALGDYLNTGDALRIKIPGSSPERYYYIENHQKLSAFDDIDATSDGKGLYVLYQGGNANGNDDIYFYNAEGRAEWTYIRNENRPSDGASLPVFERGLQNESNGQFDTYKINYYDPNDAENKSSFVYAFSNESGQTVWETKYRGDGKDMLKPGVNEVLSPWSNPSLENVSLHVIDDNGTLKVYQYVETNTQKNSPPVKPQNFAGTEQSNHPKLTWDANTEPDLQHYEVWKKVNCQAESKFPQFAEFKIPQFVSCCQLIIMFLQTIPSFFS